MTRHQHGGGDTPFWHSAEMSGPRKAQPQGRPGRISDMCRNIRTLFNFDPPATDEEIRAASLQFVRKLSGFTKPSAANQAVFDGAIDEVAGVARRLIDALVTNAPPRDREEWAARARARAAERYGTQRT